MKNIFYNLQNAIICMFRYFRYDHTGKASIAGSIFGVAVLVILFGGLISVFLQYGILILVLIFPWLLARVTCKSMQVRNIIVIGLGIITMSYFILHWSITVILWILTVIYAVTPEKYDLPKDGFI